MESPPPGSADATPTVAGGSRSAGAFGPYRLLQRIGEGGMGEVWLAEQTRPIHRRVALKIIKAGMDTGQVLGRFEAERQALALMNHPAIATVFDGGITPDGRPYFSLEYVQGEPITTYCDRHRLRTRERLQLFIRVCDGVQHAHHKGVIHRDLKPSNVLVTLADEEPVPKIIDFGVAKATTQPLTDRTLFTEFGMFIGTPEYMSPEQAELTGLDIDTRADVYALGVLLYELLTGTLPFDRTMMRDKGLDEIRRTIREVDPPRPSTRVTHLDRAAPAAAANRQIEANRLAIQLRGDLDWITMKALEKDRTRRYQTANALALEVRRYLNDEPVTAGPPSALYRGRKFVRRHRVSVSAGAALMILVLALAIVMTIEAGRFARERDRANQQAAVARQVSEFLVGLFTVSDPSEARGKSLTAREILQRGAMQLDRGLRDQPHVRARLEATIGTVYTNLGLYEDALPLLERALETERRVAGADDPDTLATAHGLANLYWYLGKYPEAERLYTDVAARRTRVLGVDDPATLRTQYDLASLYALQKRWTEFERLGRDTLERQRRVLGPANVDTLSSMNNLQYFYYKQGRYSEAEPLSLAVYEGRRALLGDDHPETLLALHNRATIYDAQRRYPEAERLYLDALAAKRRVLGAEHPLTCATLSQLASMYLKERRYAEAESAALAAYRGYSKALGPDHEDTRKAVETLEKIYAAAGQPEAAATWRAKRPVE